MAETRNQAVDQVSRLFKTLSGTQKAVIAVVTIAAIVAVVALVNTSLNKPTPLSLVTTSEGAAPEIGSVVWAVMPVPEPTDIVTEAVVIVWLSTLKYIEVPCATVPPICVAMELAEGRVIVIPEEPEKVK